MHLYHEHHVLGLENRLGQHLHFTAEGTGAVQGGYDPCPGSPGWVTELCQLCPSVLPDPQQVCEQSLQGKVFVQLGKGIRARQKRRHRGQRGWFWARSPPATFLVLETGTFSVLLGYEAGSHPEWLWRGSSSVGTPRSVHSLCYAAPHKSGAPVLGQRPGRI